MIIFIGSCHAEMVASLCFEAMFYIGLGAFLSVTDSVQRPYLQFSPKRWGLITGLRGYLTSSFFTTGFKVIAPLFAVYVTWPVLGLQALVAVAPFLVGCAAQLAFEAHLNKRGSSCWPIVPIIFEVVDVQLRFIIFGNENQFQLRFVFVETNVLRLSFYLTGI